MKERLYRMNLRWYFYGKAKHIEWRTLRPIGEATKFLQYVKGDIEYLTEYWLVPV